jgi:hypothetical protein
MSLLRLRGGKDREFGSLADRHFPHPNSTLHESFPHKLLLPVTTRAGAHHIIKPLVQHKLVARKGGHKTGR